MNESKPDIVAIPSLPEIELWILLGKYTFNLVIVGGPEIRVPHHLGFSKSSYPGPSPKALVPRLGEAHPEYVNLTQPHCQVRNITLDMPSKYSAPGIVPSPRTHTE